MIDGQRIWAYTWNSCTEIDNLIDYLNSLDLPDDVYQKLEAQFKDLIGEYSGTKEQAMGEDA